MAAMRAGAQQHKAPAQDVPHPIHPYHNVARPGAESYQPEELALQRRFDRCRDRVSVHRHSPRRLRS